MMLRRALIAAAAVTCAAFPLHAHAANARSPYANIDPRVDAGNDTGDAQVDRLNEAQLGGSGTRSPYPQHYARPYAQGYPGYAQNPPGNYAAQAYAPPRYAPYPYAPPPGYQAAPYAGAPYPGAYPQY